MNKFLKVIIVNLLILAAFLLIFEMALRIFWRMSALKEGIYRVSQNKTLRYELKPNIRATYACKEIITNSAGFRGQEFSIQKNPGVYRIILIGDSVAFGKLLSFEDTIGERLKSALAAACPAKKFEVFNMGVEGYNSIQELELLKTKALKYNPDLVIVYYCFNDPENPEYYFKKNFLTLHSQLARYILHKSQKYKFKKEKKKKGIKNIEENFRYLYSTDCWKHTKEAIMEMGDLTAAKGIKMILLIVPEMSAPVKDFGDGYPFLYINEKLEGIKHSNITVIDPIREFSRLGLKKEGLVAWAYPIREANDIIAGYTIAKFKENNINFCE